MTDPHFLPIDPGLAPGGLVFRVCEEDMRTVLREHYAAGNGDDDWVEVFAREDAEYVMSLLDQGAETIWLITYDGDSGRCVAALKHSRRPDPSAN